MNMALLFLISLLFVTFVLQSILVSTNTETYLAAVVSVDLGNVTKNVTTVLWFDDDNFGGEAAANDGSIMTNNNNEGSMTNDVGSMTNDEGSTTNDEGGMTNDEGSMTNNEGSATDDGDVISCKKNDDGGNDLIFAVAAVAALFQNHIWNNVPIVSNIGNNNMIAPLGTWVAVPVVLYVLAWENAEEERFRLPDQFFEYHQSQSMEDFHVLPVSWSVDARVSFPLFLQHMGAMGQQASEEVFNALTPNPWVDSIDVLDDLCHRLLAQSMKLFSLMSCCHVLILWVI